LEGYRLRHVDQPPAQLVCGPTNVMGGMIAFIILALVMVPVFFVTVQLWHAGAPAPVKS